MHQVSFSATSELNKQVIIKQILEHKCVTCSKLISAFVPIRTIQSLAEQQYNHRQKKLQPLQKNKFPQNVIHPFPPKLPAKELLDQIS